MRRNLPNRDRSLSKRQVLATKLAFFIRHNGIAKKRLQTEAATVSA